MKRVEYKACATMTIPDYQSLMLPILKLAANGETSIGACLDKIAEDFNIDVEERSQLLPSGRQTVFSNRAHWAKTYLQKAGLLESTRRAHFMATSRGLEVLASNPPRVDNALLDRFPEFRAFRTGSAATRGQEDTARSPQLSPSNDTSTPVERIEAAYEEITAELRSELLARVVGGTPEFFERLIVDLLISMGYGGSRPEAGKRLGRSGDGGVDGLVNEDILGLDSIYLQAKRYASGNGIGVEKVREFAGSLVERGANKGVFVTTSHFAPAAKTYTERIPQKIILIDGEALTGLMVRYSVGVRLVRQLDLKRLDVDYFDEEEDG